MKIQRTPIASAVALLLTGVIVTAQAQQAADAPAPAASGAAPAQKLETVVITGIRASREKSLDQKRNSDTLVEVVTAEDVGKMPDKNVADSLQRLPGISVDRFWGEGRDIFIRGTDNTLNRTQMNGQNVASSGDLARLYQQFATISLVQAEVQRGSATVQLSYAIQP